MQSEMKFSHKLTIVWFLIKKQVEMSYNICPEMLSFREACHPQIV
jgi:hypothetical protein